MLNIKLMYHLIVSLSQKGRFVKWKMNFLMKL